MVTMSPRRAHRSPRSRRLAALSARRYPGAIVAFRLGTQSWTSFPDWVGVFYPPRLSSTDALGFYSQIFDTVEVNTTFYALPTEGTVRAWYERTCPGFSFALKFPRAITHDLRLELPAAEPATRELLRLAGILGDKCGPLLLQLPPSFDRSAANRRALAAFLELIPPDHPRLAIELRHPAWADPAVETALAERNIAWVLVEGDQPNNRSLMFPADFTYVRWNRSGLPFDNWAHIQHDRTEALDWWTAVLQSLPARVQTCYGYMSNEFAGHAPASLRMLCDRLGLPSIDPRSRWPQGVLF
jgi:uncharacterized protein YecE (DUF72 family)